MKFSLRKGIFCIVYTLTLDGDRELETKSKDLRSQSLRPNHLSCKSENGMNLHLHDLSDLRFISFIHLFFVLLVFSIVFLFQFHLLSSLNSGCFGLIFFF